MTEGRPTVELREVDANNVRRPTGEMQHGEAVQHLDLAG